MAALANVGLRVLFAGVVAGATMTALPALAQAPSTALPKLTLPGVNAPPAAGSAAAAQPAAQAPWTKLCAADPTTKKNVCAVRAQLPDSTGQQLLISVTVQTVQDDPKMLLIVTVPPGMLLQPGVQVAIDSAKPMALGYTICAPNACFAQADFTADNLKALRAGKQVTIAALDQTGAQQAMPISLAGFAKAYDGPGIDPSTPSGQAQLDALNSSLQQHADQARQALSNAPAPGK